MEYFHSQILGDEMATIVVLLSLKALIVKEGKILLVRRSLQDSWNPGKWECPGGKAETGDRLDDALIREVFEETGFQVKTNSGISFVIHDQAKARKYKDVPHVVIFHRVSLESGELTLSHEHCGFAWEPCARAVLYDLTQETRCALEGLRTDTSFLQ